MFKRLHPFYEMDGDIGASSGVDPIPAAEEQVTTQVDPSSEPGANPEVAAEPEKQNNYEKAFAKRLAEAQSKWESEKQTEIQKMQEQYKDYDVSKKAMQYLQRTYGIDDAMTLNEQLELADLQDRAASENLTVEELQRRQELEGLKAWKNQVEQKQAEDERVTAYQSALNEFVKDKGVESESLNQFMIDNDLRYYLDSPEKSFTLALNAMNAEEYKQQATAREEEVINKYLASKQAPKVEGSVGAAGSQTVDTSKMSWKDLTRHAAGRIDASKTAQ